MPVITTPARKVGHVSLWHMDDGFFATFGTEAREYDLGPFETAGQMFDAIIKWATDRGLVVPWVGLELDLVLPAKVAGRPRRVGN